MTPPRGTLTVALLVFAGVLGLVVSRAPGQQIIQYGFETRDPVWKAERADAAYKVLVHALTDETAHGGQRCEHIQLRAEKGSYIQYVYKVGRAPVTEDLSAGIWLKSNRPGVALSCRIILPHERDPDTVGQPLSVSVKCEPYGIAGRWKLLSLNSPVKRLQEQQHLLQVKLGRDVNINDAYVSELLLNLYDGPGLVDVWIDDLEIGPVFDTPLPLGTGTNPTGRAPVAATPASRDGMPQGAPQAGGRSDLVRLDPPRLLVSGQKFFPIGIRHTGTPFKVLHEAGINTLWLDESTPNEMIQEAVNLGFWVVPTITPPSPMPRDMTVSGQTPAHFVSAEAFAAAVARFQNTDAVLCYNLGDNLTAENFPDIVRAARAFRTLDPMRPVTADIWDGFKSYSRSLDGCMIGVHRWPLMTSLEMTGYRDWLIQRRRLATPGSFCWTWIQNHSPDWFVSLNHDAGVDKGPTGPTPEQVRLLAYTALGCGYRGLAFWSDRSLADSHTGRDRLLGLALLNQELQMLGPLLLEADANKDPEWIGTSVGGVEAAILRTTKGVLVLPVWQGPGSQFVPGQSAATSLTMTVPLVPITTQAWAVSPGGVRALPTKRVIGGTQVTLRNFSLTSAILFTSDLSPTGVIVHLQDQQRRLGRQAAQWAQQEAQEELTKVEQVQTTLTQAGKAIPDSPALLKKAHEAIDACAGHRRNGEHSDAYDDAQIALRALRVLMRAQWDSAVRDFDQVVSSPYAVSYFTLPKHYELLDELHHMQASANVLPDGDFETPPESVPQGWMVQEVPSLDNVRMTAKRVKDAPLHGKQCLQLSLAGKTELAPSVLERSFLALHSPSVKLKPGTLVRITAWVRTRGTTGSPDGALVYDSSCGEPLAVRIPSTKGWRRVTLFRRVPASGSINVTLATSAYGDVYFDDVRIEPLLAAGDYVPQTIPPPTQQRPVAAGPR
jgi:hypothetical protein